MFVKMLVWENEKPALTFTQNAALVLLSSVLLGLLGQLAIRLPFTPIPIVTQAQAALLLGFLLGPHRAAAAVFAFLIQGAMGFPVFANGGAGVMTLIGPRGGYLIGYMIGAFIVGKIWERVRERTPLRAFLTLCLGNSILYLLGAAYLSTFVGIQKAIWLGIAPFILVDVIKNIACVKILQWIDG